MGKKIFISTFICENLNDNNILFHGTNSRFKTFNDNKPIFFVDDVNVAKTYGNIIIKARLNIDNPLELDFNDRSTYYFFNRWYLPSDLANKIKEISDDIKKNYTLDDDLKDYLEELDYNELYGDLDGIIMKNINDDYNLISRNKPATNYVVFDKNQIKIVK